MQQWVILGLCGPREWRELEVLFVFMALMMRILIYALLTHHPEKRNVIDWFEQEVPAVTAV